MNREYTAPLQLPLSRKEIARMGVQVVDKAAEMIEKGIDAGEKKKKKKKGGGQTLRAERRNLWAEMGIVAALSCPWVVLGDFNATLYSHEKRGPGRFNVGSAAEFQAVVDACDLISSPSQGSNFTWTNNRCRGHVAARLDISFFNAQWLDVFGDCGQKVLHRSISDHAPILFSSAAIPKPRNAPFRLHRFWMKEESFVDLMAAKKEASTSVVAWPPEVLDFMAEDAMGRSRFRFY
ncbi:uncharacterized protein LOC122067036 [Macadamia integrifolia]|uniref:uncharacterized protein LOC122067036 n=1 Tax=Macadamia integrifolia TaxID=60698 RepID=UPI001C4FDD67|nr:uncharacterized protein LOC122067036 [Macadamia integrifolia]